MTSARTKVTAPLYIGVRKPHAKGDWEYIVWYVDDGKAYLVSEPWK